MLLLLGIDQALIRVGSRISGNGVHMYKYVGVCFASFISFFLNIPGLTETKLIIGYLNRRAGEGRGAGFKRTP